MDILRGPYCGEGAGAGRHRLHRQPAGRATGRAGPQHHAADPARDQCAGT